MLSSRISSSANTQLKSRSCTFSDALEILVLYLYIHVYTHILKYIRVYIYTYVYIHDRVLDSFVCSRTCTLSACKYVYIIGQLKAVCVCDMCV